MTKCEYVRCDHRIKNVITGVIETYKHINEAKRQSAKIQNATKGGLGCGVLRKVPKL